MDERTALGSWLEAAFLSPGRVCLAWLADWRAGSKPPARRGLPRLDAAWLVSCFQLIPISIFSKHCLLPNSLLRG